MQIIRNFIGQADNADHPQKKKYGRVELVGPFSVRDGEDNYQLYLFVRPAVLNPISLTYCLTARYYC